MSMNPLKAKPTQTRSSKAALQFPVGRVHRLLKLGKHARRIGSTAPVYLAAVLEYVTSEVLDLAGDAAKENNKSRIGPRHLCLAVRSDPELNKFLSGVMVASFGTMPNIHSLLVRKNAKGKAKEAEDDQAAE